VKSRTGISGLPAERLKKCHQRALPHDLDFKKEKSWRCTLGQLVKCNGAEKLKEICCSLLGLCFFAGSILLAVAFIYGATWVSAKAMPWLYAAFFLAIGFTIFVSLPLSFFRRTRLFAANSFIVVSYIFGLNLWCFALLSTVIYGGTLMAIIGLMVAGVGIVPVALVTIVSKGEWWHLLDLIFLIVLTFGCRGLGKWISCNIEMVGRRGYQLAAN
jgi:hypothetical protein